MLRTLAAQLNISFCGGAATTVAVHVCACVFVICVWCVRWHIYSSQSDIFVDMELNLLWMDAKSILMFRSIHCQRFYVANKHMNQNICIAFYKLGTHLIQHHTHTRTQCSNEWNIIKFQIQLNWRWIFDFYVRFLCFSMLIETDRLAYPKRIEFLFVMPMYLFEKLSELRMDFRLSQFQMYGG